MSFFIFNKVNNEIYKIAENDTDLNTLTVPEDQYFKINANQEDFDSVRLVKKIILPYNGSLQLQSINVGFNRNLLKSYIDKNISLINSFLNSQPQSIVFQKWFNYKTLLSNLNIENLIPSPSGSLSMSLEEYLQNQGQSSLNILQLP